ncbi:MAG: TIGR01777 family oxidoreductase [Myxococcota bacterium]
MQSETRTIFLTGASGLLGRSLMARWTSVGHRVRALSRRTQPESADPNIDWICGDLTQEGSWSSSLDGVDVVVNLAGEPISEGRWTETRKEELRHSRIRGTQRLVQAIGASAKPPEVLINASASGYYGPRFEENLVETSSAGDDFLASLAKDWEAAAGGVEVFGTRLVRLRFGTILSARGGALLRMLPIFRTGLGGPLGPKEFFAPWIHIEDAMGFVDWGMAQTGLSGPVNAVSPEPIRMGEFAHRLGRAVHRPAFFPVPTFLLKVVLGEMGGSLFPGQRVDPQVAMDRGYPYRFPDLEGALADLLG